MHLLQVVVFLLFCAVALGWLARKAGLPYPIALVLGGGALGFVPGLPQLDFDPQFLLVLILPPILYQAALLTSWRDFSANLREIGLLGVGLVVVTTLAVGAVLKLLVPGMPWAVAFTFGAIVSPPDAVAATAILSRLNIPRRVVTVLEGESLVNDASGLVLYKFAVVAVLSGVFSLFDASLQFCVVAVGGTLIGMAAGWFFIHVHKRLGDPFTEVLLSLAIPYAAYIAAESIHVSGVLAVVAAGLVRGRQAPEIVSAQMRILARSVWNVFVFLLNSIVFMLIGMQLSDILGRLNQYTTGELVYWSLAASLTAIGVRFLWVYIATWLPRVFGWTRAGQTPPPAETFIISWCGMRGIVSLAVALALPVQTATAEGFPFRDLIIFLTFVVIFVTLVFQGLSLAPLILRLKVGHDDTLRVEEKRARESMNRAALTAIDAHSGETRLDAALVEPVRAEFAAALEESAPENFPEARALRRAALRAERRELIALWRANCVSDEVMRHLEEELDYREARL